MRDCSKTILLLLTWTVLAAAASAQQEIWRWEGVGQLGRSVAGAGDTDGDGRPDLLVGAPYDSAYEVGAAHLYSGSDGTNLRRWLGDSDYDHFGWRVAAAGDVDDDGRADLLVGAWGYTRVFSGLDGSIVHEFQTSGAVDGAGDVDGDGWDDVILGSTDVAFVYSGRDGSVLHALQGGPYEEFGVAVSAAGDLDGDGFADFAVGATDCGWLCGPGHVKTFSGADGSELAEYEGDEGGDGFGFAVSAAGDVDGDGSPDLVVGAPWASVNRARTGLARVHSGANGAVLFDFAGDFPWVQLGHSVAGAGDVNGDGFPDVLAGSVPACDRFGFARLVSGKDGATLYTFRGDDDRTDLGRSVDGAGDVDGDGFADVIIGSAGTAGGIDGAMVFGGNDLYLDGDPRLYHRWEEVTLVTRPGPPANPAILFLVAWDGAPLWQPVAAGAFDAAGQFALSGFAPPAVEGHSLTLRSYALDFGGRVVDSAGETIRFP